MSVARIRGELWQEDGMKQHAAHFPFCRCLLSSAVRPSALRLRARPGSGRPLHGRGRGLQVGGRPPDCQRGGRYVVAGLSPGRRPQSCGTGPLSAASPEVGDLNAPTI